MSESSPTSEKNRSNIVTILTDNDENSPGSPKMYVIDPNSSEVKVYSQASTLFLELNSEIKDSVTPLQPPLKRRKLEDCNDEDCFVIPAPGEIARQNSMSEKVQELEIKWAEKRLECLEQSHEMNMQILKLKRDILSQQALGGESKINKRFSSGPI